MAVIKNNKTGMWEVRTYYKDLTGARKQKTKRGFAKKSEVLEWERNFKLKEDQSISMIFKSFVDIYLMDLEPRIKRNTFLTERAQFELEEVEKLKKELLRVADGDDYLKEQVIELRYQNQILREENRSLKDKLEKAYEFMKQFVIGGINLLEKFMEWIGEKVKDVGRGR